MFKKLARIVEISFLALILVVNINMASAQVLDVTQKPRPEYDPIGVPVGSFILFPEVQVHETYDSNIYAQSDNETDDFVTSIKPSATLESDWSNHSLVVTADGDWGIYGSNSDEDFFDYSVVARGRVDVRRTFNIFGSVGYGHAHQDRGSPDAVQSATEPAEFDGARADLGFDWKLNRFGVIGEVRYLDLDFDDTFTAAGVVINNDDRDRVESLGRLRLSYDIQPGYALFVEGAYNKREYDNIPDDNGVNRNSDGYRLDAGVEFDITDKMRGDVFAGYYDQDYESITLADSNGLNFGGNLLWSISPLTTVTVTLSRAVRETTAGGASSFLSTDGRVGVDHELMRNLLVGASVRLTNNDYDGLNRDDDIIRLRAYGKYFITRNFFAGADAQYIDRDSNVVGVPYTRYKLGAFVGAQF